MSGNNRIEFEREHNFRLRKSNIRGLDRCFNTAIIHTVYGGRGLWIDRFLHNASSLVQSIGHGVDPNDRP